MAAKERRTRVQVSRMLGPEGKTEVIWEADWVCRRAKDGSWQGRLELPKEGGLLGKPADRGEQPSPDRE